MPTIGFKISQDCSFVQTSCPNCRRWNSYPDKLSVPWQEDMALRFKCNSCGTVYAVHAKQLKGGQ